MRKKSHKIKQLLIYLSVFRLMEKTFYKGKKVLNPHVGSTHRSERRGAQKCVNFANVAHTDQLNYEF